MINLEKRTMQEQKQFILQFLEKEAECWTKRQLNDVTLYNKWVQELYAMASGNMDQAFGIICKNRLREEENPIVYLPAYLFKLSNFSHPDFGSLWIAYTSYNNPIVTSSNSGISRGFIISEIKSELKIIGMMSIALRDSDLMPVAWEKSMYNASNLNIHDFGEFIAAERYMEPKDDGFSLQDYLAEK